MTGDREATRRLLAERHPGAVRFDDHAWLNWLYDDPPDGRAIEADRDGGGRRIGHVGLVRQPWVRDGELDQVLMAVNVATSADSGEPLFAQLLAAGIAEGMAGGVAWTWGITNAQSTRSTSRDIGARMLCSLPVVLARGLRRGGVRSFDVDPDRVDVAWVAARVGELDPRPVPGRWTQQWTTERLAWRLRAPGRRYALHVGDRGIAVSTVERRGIRVGVLTKVLPRRDPLTAGEVRRLVGAVRRHHRVGPVVYAGFNAAAPVTGVRVPGPLRPASLNLFVFGGDDARRFGLAGGDGPRAVDSDDLEIATCELLDFDAV